MSSSNGRDAPRPLARTLNRIALFTFALYLVVTLATGSVARTRGPLTWLLLWRLPAGDGQWESIGVLGLLPLISGISWITSRAAGRSIKSIQWGWRRVSWPLATLCLLGLLSTTLRCLDTDCNAASFFRLCLLLAHLVWAYALLINDKPDLFWVVIAILTVQSSVAIGQFLLQRDLDLSILGEAVLDPQVSGISVVMRGSTRWLRAYGLATHPNVLAGTLVSILLMLPVFDRAAGFRRRLVATLVFVLGFTALLTTLSRWAAVCLALGLGINLIPWVSERIWFRRRIRPSMGSSAWAGIIVIAILFLTIYGDTVAGRVAGLETSIESRSLSERSRDTELSLKLIAAHPLTGVGLGEYISAARQFDVTAELVHNVPLHLAAEIGIWGIAVWLWLVLAPVLRRGALTCYAPETGLWLAFWLLGLLQPAPNPLYELRSVLLAGWIAGILAQSGTTTKQESQTVAV